MCTYSHINILENLIKERHRKAIWNGIRRKA